MLEFDPELAGAGFRRPSDVLRAAGLSLEQKRAVLANWASDMRAVEDAPGLRRLDSGIVIEIDAILDAMARLDGMRRHGSLAKWRRPGQRRKPWWSRHDNDDDDPPLAPAGAWSPRPIDQPDAAAVAA